jgi:hypothetical protein
MIALRKAPSFRHPLSAKLQFTSFNGHFMVRKILAEKRKERA